MTGSRYEKLWNHVAAKIEAISLQTWTFCIDGAVQMFNISSILSEWLHVNTLFMREVSDCL